MGRSLLPERVLGAGSEPTDAARLVGRAVQRTPAADGGVAGAAGQDEAVGCGAGGCVLAVGAHGDLDEQSVEVGVGERGNRLVFLPLRHAIGTRWHAPIL